MKDGTILFRSVPMSQTSLHSSKVKLPQVISLYIGAVLGSGILILPGIAAEIAGPASLISWVLMIVMAIPMASTMGLLAARFPDSGGVSHFVGLAYNNKLGSLVGWFFLMSVVAGAPVLALTGAGYLTAALGLTDGFRIVFTVAILVFALTLNYFGMKVTGIVQTVVVSVIIVVLLAVIVSSIGSIDAKNFQPFMPSGWLSVGNAASLLFWSFLGWEAVAHLSAEFEDPEKMAIRGTVITTGIIAVLYFLTALAVVGTKTYGGDISNVSLIEIIRNRFGVAGAMIGGFAAFFVCLAPTIAYIGAASRLASSLADSGFAPKALTIKSKKLGSPVGGLVFLAICFLAILALAASNLLTMTQLLQIPNATFILTYIGGCAAGLVLLRDRRFGWWMSLIALILSCAILIFIGWSILYPIAITIFWAAMLLKKRLDQKNRIDTHN